MEVAEIIYQNLNLLLKELEITLDKVEEYQIEPEVFHQAVEDVKQRLLVKLRSGVCSQLLIEQLARHKCNLGENFNGKIEFYHLSTLLEYIELIENNERIGKPFTRLPLKGFYHVHHSPIAGKGYPYIRNIIEYWYHNGKIKPQKQAIFDSLVKKFGPKQTSTIFNSMKNQVLFGSKMNGEWMIYKELSGKKYYLCLATHYEGDENIYDNKIVPCLKEFPELQA